MKKILGIGNTLVDILIKLDQDSLLKKINLEKGSMTLVDKPRANEILKMSDQLKKEKSSGGSAANTINGLARMGVQAGFVGKIGDDSYGQFFQQDMRKYKISPYLSVGKEDTGKCLVLISKDSERTFATYLGASVELDASDISSQLFSRYDYVYFEGYLVINRDLVNKIVEYSEKAGCKIVIDLSSYNVVEDNREYLFKLLQDHIDIVFANETEAMSLTGEKNPESALEDIAQLTEIAVVKIGKDGSLIKKGNDKFVISAVRANAVDTTGAGDLYASGFLYSLLKGYPLDICGRLGSLVSGQVVELIGARMNDATWIEIINSIKIIENQVNKLSQG